MGDRRGTPWVEGRRAAAIADLSLQLARATSTRVLEQEVVRHVSELVGDVAVLWRRDDEGRIALVATTHHDPHVRAYLEAETSGMVAAADDDYGVLPHVWTAGRPVRFGPEELALWLPHMQEPYRRYARVHGMAGLLLVPLVVRGHVIALLGVARDRPPDLDADDELFVQQIGSVIAVALDHDRLLRQARALLAEQSRAHVAAHRAALHDALTGLPNRRLLLERLHAVAGREGQGIALLMVDLDDFKDLNDAHGHASGDSALVEVARRLEAALRAHPLSPRSTLARLGGDEFAVLVVLPEDGELPEDLVSAVLGALRPPLRLHGVEIALEASVGVAVGPAVAGSTLMRHADIAMYRAKRTRAGWARYAPEHDAAAEARLTELSDLDAALESDQIELVHQPVVPRHASDAEGPLLVEALVRWRHPERGVLLPERFLPLAQQTGRMGRLTEVVVEAALRDLVRWREGGRDVQVALNVGADVLAEPGFLPSLTAALRSRGLPPSSVCLELTEAEVLSPEGPGLLSRARAAGLTVALDDFGTGYSSLAYLADLPLDRLKLDRSFVHRLSGSERTARFVAELVALVHGLGLPVVAEGVEDADDARRLDALGVEFQQGYWHCVPGSPELVERHWAGVGA